jgi:hypothetical protein
VNRLRGHIGDSRDGGGTQALFRSAGLAKRVNS